MASSSKSGKRDILEGDWDPTYDGFAAAGPGVVTAIAPPEAAGSGPKRGDSPENSRLETPKGRPLPTLREIHQINLRRAIEEDRATKPCDICGDPNHDYRQCQAGAKPESEPPTPEQMGDTRCRNCDGGHPGQCPCGWCGENGHISSDCQAKHYSRAMQERFPKKKRTKKKKILEYTCRRCGDKHPFNRYCPYAIEPPIIPGECRSCATLTNHHDDGCELVELKDRIGMCAFCGDVSHTYAECPDRYPNRTPKRVMGRGEGRRRASPPTEPARAPDPPAYYGVCSFCGSAGHGHEECPGLKEAVREQAAQLARVQIVRYEAAREGTHGRGNREEGRTQRVCKRTRP